ncbi:MULTISPECIES: sulfatase-like hydrolase/transferase [Haloferax]|nr:MULTISPECIES: sulfatase-like hydrolase/transferase [Haloferax]
MTRDDIVLITVDCWRPDTLTRMDSVQSSTLSQDFAIAQGAATNGVFPAIFASQYYPEVYDETGAVKGSCRTLPSVLSELGYNTGGFVASNPYLSKWRDEFDTFWNDGLSPTDEFKSGNIVENIVRLFSMKSRVPAPDLLNRAGTWWRNSDSPRFLWLHFMDLHSPYLPGLKRVLQTGPIKSLQTLNHEWSDSRKPDEKYQDSYKDLYYHCVDYFDNFLESLFDFIPNDAHTIMTGDHGEGFDHDVWGHAQLYDEVVKVPFLYRGPTRSDQKKLIRHVDIPIMFLDAIDSEPPTQWRGSFEDDEPFIINHAPRIGETYVGYRNERWKFIRRYGSHGKYETELYDLKEDPDEVVNISNSDLIEELDAAVNSFISSDSIDQERIGEHLVGFNQDNSVTSRLQDLGYVE